MCEKCAQMVYGVLLPSDVENLIMFYEVLLQYNYCPNYFSFLSNSTEFMASCVTWNTASFAYPYRIFYSLFQPYRDYMCPLVCGGDTGEDIVYLTKRK